MRFGLIYLAFFLDFQRCNAYSFRHIGHFSWSINSVDHCFYPSVVGWESCYKRQSDLWRCVARNIGWSDCVYYRCFRCRLLGAVIGSVAWIVGYIIALLAWIWVFKASFQTSWLQAILIALLAWVIPIVLSIVVGKLFGIAYPAQFFPKI